MDPSLDSADLPNQAARPGGEPHPPANVGHLADGRETTESGRAEPEKERRKDTDSGTDLTDGVDGERGPVGDGGVPAEEDDLLHFLPHCLLPAAVQIIFRHDAVPVLQQPHSAVCVARHDPLSPLFNHRTNFRSPRIKPPPRPRR